MKKTAVICEKGSTRNSVIASGLYESNMRQVLRVSLYSLAVHYLDMSGDKKAKEAKLAFVNTSSMLMNNLTDIGAGTDVLVIPVGPTPNATEPFTHTISIAAKNTVATIVIIVNSFHMYASFMEYLCKKPWIKNVVTVTQPEAIGQAQGCKKSVFAIGGRDLNFEAVCLIWHKMNVFASFPSERVKRQIQNDVHNLLV